MGRPLGVRVLRVGCRRAEAGQNPLRTGSAVHLEQDGIALAALHHASRALAELTSDSVYDVEFAEVAAGGDVAAFIDDSLRFTRAAYAIAHTVTERG